MLRAGAKPSYFRQNAPPPLHPPAAAIRCLRANPALWPFPSPNAAPKRRGAGVAAAGGNAVPYTPLRAHETRGTLVCRLLLEKKKKSTDLY